MRILWHMPTLRSSSCGLSIRARGLALQLIASGHQVGFVVDAAKTDIAAQQIDGIPLMKLRGSTRDPRHWTLQAIDRRDLARDLVAALEVPHDLFVTSQPEAVTAYKARNPGRPAMFVCGGTTLLHDSMEKLQQGRHPFHRRPAFAIDRFLKQQNERAAFESADATVFDSASTRDLVVESYGLGSNRFYPIVGAVDDRLFQPASPHLKWYVRRHLGIGADDYVVAWSGRLAPEKNLSQLLKAVARCNRPPECLLLAGDGPLREALQAEAVAMRVAQRVRFLGDQPDLRPFLHAADVFAFPSRSESLGLSMLEAMACGLPVVAFKPDGETIMTASGEVLDAGRSGLLVEPASPAALAAALDHLRADSCARVNFGLSARRRATECYNWPGVGRQLVAIVDELLGRRTTLRTSGDQSKSRLSGAIN